MLLPLWPLFLMDTTSPIDVPEVEVVKESTEMMVVSVDEGDMIVKDSCGY